MNADWMKVGFRTDASKLETLLPPGFALRGEPIVSVSCATFRNLYWLAGRGYGILSVDFPVRYAGRTETIDGNFCPVIWEGRPEAVVTGRDELGFSKMPADIPEIDWDQDAGTAWCAVSSMEHVFCEVSLTELLEEENPAKVLPGSGATAQNISFDGFAFRRWTGRGAVTWHKATFEQLPIQFPIVNALADLDIHEVVDSEMVSFSGPGIAIAANGMRPIEPADESEAA